MGKMLGVHKWFCHISYTSNKIEIMLRLRIAVNIRYITNRSSYTNIICVLNDMK